MQQYRAMQPDADGLPRVGRSGRSLGIRIGDDVVPAEDGSVQPGLGGMSVSPGSIWNVPSHRRPRGMARGSTGNAADRIYAVDEASVTARDLVVRPDPNNRTRHAFIEPAVRMPIETFESELASTRPLWRQSWPT